MAIPAICVDTRKKELVGNFKNGGRNKAEYVRQRRMDGADDDPVTRLVCAHIMELIEQLDARPSTQ